MKASLGASLLLVVWASCAGGAPAVDREALRGKTPLNPAAPDGRPIHLGFGHHPDCFVLAPGGRAETLSCPDVALVRLTPCPGGLLYRGDDGGCICVPADGSEASRVECRSE